MIELNLLPDVKMEFIRAQRQRRLILSVSLLVSGAAVAAAIALFVVGLAQKEHLKDLSADIISKANSLKAKPQLDKILTVQNQLKSFTALHEGKPAATRLFTYLNQVTPVEVNLGDLNINFTTQTATITGTADSLSSVNKYIDTLKFTSYKVKGVQGQQPAFNSVVLTAFSLKTDVEDKAEAATYTIGFLYAPDIFNITQKVTLVVPKQVTTRSVLLQPTQLFKKVPETKTPAATTGGGE